MRISNWATRFNVKVVRCEERADNPPGAVVYRIKDIFTTRDGQWDPSDKPGSVDQWARASYLRPFNAPDYFDDAGGDHNIFARVLDEEGRPLATQDLVICWSDGVHLLGESNFDQYIKMRMTPKTRSGWANQPIWNSFGPERGETGAWAWCPRGAADVIVGGGLPNNLHVSWFVVWQAERRSDSDGGDGNHGSEIPTISLDALRAAVWQAAGVVLQRESAFLAYARQHTLGAPVTAAFDVESYRVQGFANGIVYAPIGDWDATGHMQW
ncbi:MAG: hypothetical protein R3E79_57685 [Caldilineaceae bacterium]